MITEHGGKVVIDPNSTVTHAVVGTDANRSKIAAFDSLGIKKTDEDGLFDIMRASCMQMAWTEKYAPRSLSDVVENKLVLEDLGIWLIGWRSSSCNLMVTR